MHYPPPPFLLVITLLAASWTLFSDENNLGSAAPDHASPTSPTAQTRVKGRMTIVASDAVKPLISVLAAKFLRKHPEVTIAVQGAGKTYFNLNSNPRPWLVGFVLGGRSEPGAALYRLACRSDLEGIVANRADSR